MENEFDHYGVKGMRWGRRKQQRASGYTDKQYNQDKAVYGKGGAKRINKRMLSDNYGLRGARSAEATMHNAAVKKSKAGAKAGAKIGGYTGLAAGYLAGSTVQKAGTIAVAAITKNRNLSYIAYSALGSIDGRTAIAMGSAAVGAAIGKNAGRTIPLATKGYDR